ncbi:DedA family protein [Mangrovihabitans endophyticus]|uniref:VTT domain-containing protein n=1 Tax=Mangrovihabitans endophyticus TaxID=1751298 RepID=A0A8J3C4F9_9ACTN|nr:DedA family protein [Mangrovihabitans endophyticus]GGL08658.1 hypothetical protein GCM10012284_49080 [Mangrovihabitans endophyticus]
MTDLLTVLTTPAWIYLAIFGFLTVDAMVPVFPVQAIMITSGALTVYGNLELPVVIAVGALGMFTGDALAFVLGRTSGNVGGNWLSSRLAALRQRFAPKNDEPASKTRRAAERFTRGLRQPGPLVLLLCRFVPGGRMASGYHAGRTGYPIKFFIAYDGGACLAWATYGGLVGHIGGTAVTQSAWRLFAIAATAAVVFGTAGWILALFGGRKAVDQEIAEDATATPEVDTQEAPTQQADTQQAASDDASAEQVGQAAIAARGTSTDGQPPR